MRLLSRIRTFFRARTKGCGGCSRRFQTMLESMGFIVCNNLGYVLPIQGCPCSTNPFLITWDTVKNNHTNGAFDAAKMWIKYKNLTDDERHRIIIEGRRKFGLSTQAIAGPIPNLRAVVIPATRDGDADE